MQINSKRESALKLSLWFNQEGLQLWLRRIYVSRAARIQLLSFIIRHLCIKSYSSIRRLSKSQQDSYLVQQSLTRRFLSWPQELSGWTWGRNSSCVKLVSKLIQTLLSQLSSSLEKEAEIFKWLEAHARRENTLLYLTSVYS